MPIAKAIWNKFYIDILGNISALVSVNVRKRVVVKDLLHFLGPMCFEKITQVSVYFINLLYSGNTVTIVVLNSWTIFLTWIL